MSTSLIKTILWAGMMVALTRQFPLVEYGFILSGMFILFFSINLLGIIKKICMSNEVLIVFSFLVALTVQFQFSLIFTNDPLNSVRFYLVITALLFAYYIRPNEFYVEFFLVMIALQSLITALLSIYFMVDSTAYMPFRLWLLDNDYGDLYTLDEKIYRVQLRGSGLIPFGFFVSSLLWNNGAKYKVYAMLCLSGLIAYSGVAFSLAALLFLIVRPFILFGKKGIKQAGIYSLMIIIACVSTLPFWLDFFLQKFGDAESSMGTRYDQIEVLINDLSKSAYNMLFGNGLGSKVLVTGLARDYSNMIYYEVQSLYVLNQIGIIMFCAFVLISAYLSVAKFGYRLCLLYLIFLVYAFGNPYLFDTTQFSVVVIIHSLVLYKNSGLFLNPRKWHA